MEAQQASQKAFGSPVVPDAYPVAPKSEGVIWNLTPQDIALPWRFRQLNRQQSLARLLNVSQYVTADIQPPAATNLIPADTFDTLASAELDVMLGSQHGDQVCSSLNCSLRTCIGMRIHVSLC